MNRKDLADTLRQIADAVESGDCLGGSINFNGLWGDLEQDEIECFAGVRTGNKEGMGGTVGIMEFSKGGILKDFMKVQDIDNDTEWWRIVPKI